MANLPEKNVVLVDKITNVPTDSNLFINANGEFKQASVNDVVNSSTVVSTAVETAINTAVQDSIDSNFKQTSGSPILLTDSADGTLIDFKGKGRSTQNGTPTPDSPINIKSVADGGYFDGELLQGGYSTDNGLFIGHSYLVSNKNKIPCKKGDTVNIKTEANPKYLSIVYFKDNTFVTSEYLTNVNKATFIVPNGVDSFYFNVQMENMSITPQTAKHITVTINGKYALIVKSKGKNLLNCRGLSAKTSEGVTFTPVYDDNENLLYVNANGTATETALFQLPVNLENGQYIINGCSNGSTSTYGLATQVRVSNTSNTWYASYTGDAQFETTDTKVCTHCFIQVNKGASVNNVKFYPMIRKAEVTDSTYEPYKEEVKYIPLNEPLRSSLDGTVTDEVSPTEVTRRFAEVVFDGSDDEQWLPSGVCFYINLYDTKVDTIGYCKASSTHFKNHNEWFDIYNGKIDNTFTIYKNEEWVNGRFAFYCSNITTVDELKTWLQANPITVQYELAEPITETIEPVDIVTYDNVTYITATDNAEMEIEYPTTKVAGIASIGYSKGIKAEYETEQLKKQLLEIQATIVNTL